MADDLFVGSPGRMGVTTSALEREAIITRVCVQELKEVELALRRSDGLVAEQTLRSIDAPYSAALAESAIAAARDRVAVALREAEKVGHGLPVVLARAVLNEERMRHEFSALASRFAWLGGALLPLLAALALPAALGVGISAGLAWLVAPQSRRDELVAAAAEWWRQNRSVLSTPGFVEAVRLAVTNADDAAGGLLGAPPTMVWALGEGGLQLLGVDTSAAVLLGAGIAAGVIRETPVRVSVTEREAGGTYTAGIDMLAERLPSGDEQIRIDRITAADGAVRFEVFIAGTVELGVSGTEPWDMRSNLGALAGGDPASLRAVELAMAEAGIAGGANVTFVGYSQGGLLAAKLAASGPWQVDGLVTFGAPAGQVAAPSAIPYLAIEHRDDLVPALGGEYVHSLPTIVRRAVFDAPPRLEEAVPAHLLEHYRHTATLVDASDDPRLRELLERLKHPPSARVDTTRYRAERETG